ncbi:hypothetical protein LJC09_00545 [Desulfovibrio sp. OttesenSCG-928-F20]|nr:hypothetical protein [Desulfovibrio sp. OttesenSCG-928-M16]MDL2290580.1 hypothetical protein [Desulfovibrio sp. OttesenSCG-928-F20]
MNRIFCLVLIAFVLASAGCESNQIIKDSWKFTKRQYSSYLNTPASLDMDDKGSCEVYELALGEAVMNIDAELQKLVRAMENSDHNPDPSWVMYMMSRIPWLTGVALVEGDGTVVSRYPEISAKEFDATPLLEADPKQRLGALRAYVQQHSAGPEIYVANPVYGGEELRGLIVAHFDPAALATMSNDPGSFVLASPVGVIWPGRYAGGPMVGVDWAAKLANESCGLVGDRASGFFWTTRYVGNLPLVYGMPISSTPATFTPSATTEATPAPPVEAPAPEKAIVPDAPVDAPVQKEDAAPQTPPERKRPVLQRQDPWHGHEPGKQNPVVMDAPGGM